ncbi:transmembrane protein 198 [Alligator mississippiensis]|uniref:Transmembrane protein 198 n=1 Tax=Alligator mississippiensis TaxID=8496 RepID=A0A151NDR8_ALLMI|nr:transmembrane protein 198 [Alligator mississippiensis]XP_019346400.1 transmembrane protein 198 [Alligator mississippiensis]KYO34953.1 transmembrane protein 198-like [Alligator mississippiensis]
MEPPRLPLTPQATTPGPESPGLEPCGLEPERGYDAVPAAVCALGCIFGVVYSCFGYRCFKAVMFLMGLLVGAAVVLALCSQERDARLSLAASAGLALGIGVLCGLVTLLVRSAGLFLTGLLPGLLLGAAGLVAAEPLGQPRSAWVPGGCLLGPALLGALLALRWPKALTVLSTAAGGAAAVVLGLDYGTQRLALGLHIYDCLRLALSAPLCWPSWALLGAWPMLSLLAALLQWKLTARGFSHTQGIIPRQRQLQLLRIRQQEAKKRPSPGPPEGSYRRKPPPATRFPGDVLAPSYIQSLRDRQLGASASLSSLSAVAPALPERDDDCGSITPLRPLAAPCTRP